MKAKYARWLCKKYLMPDLPDFSVSGWLLYYRPVQYILRGFSFESSGFDANSFNIDVFVQPLYVPSNHTWFNFGTRLSHLGTGVDRWWQINKDNESQVMQEVLSLMKSSGLAYLDRFKSPVDLAYKAPKSSVKSGSIPVLEAIAYSLILAGDYSEAIKKLNELRPKIEKSNNAFPGRNAWLQDTDHRVRSILKLLENQEYTETIQLLDLWTAETIDNLGII